MSRYLLLSGLVLLLSLESFPQDDAQQSDAERKADSILNEFFKNKDNNPGTEYGIDSAKLEQAESKYMDSFLKMERDEKKERLHKRILQVSIGLALLAILFIGFRRRRVINQDNRSPHR
jgi:hypothetical protein